MSTAIVRRYWTRLVADGCLICQRPATVAHCHGGSIVERMGEPKAKGKKLARYDWLCLPLCPEHAGESVNGLDAGPRKWEARFGTQAHFIDVLAVKHGLELWKLAKGTGEWRKV